MLRRIAALSNQDAETSQEHMSPQSGDVPPSPDTSRTGAFANVLRGLTSSKVSKAAPSIASPSSSAPLPTAEFVHAQAADAPPPKLSPTHMESFELLKNGSLNERITVANTLKSTISDYPLNPVLDIWYAAKDLIEPTKPSAARTAGWQLLTECVKHTASTDLERSEYFTTLSAPASPDDFNLQIAALVDLTNHGRVLAGFDYELIPLLTRWLRETYAAVRLSSRKSGKSSKGSSRGRAPESSGEKNLSSIFSFLIEVTKFSFNNVDETAANALIDKLLHICVSTNVEDDLRSSIAVIDTIVTFGSIPDEKLKGCIQVLGIIYNQVVKLQKEAWHTLSNLCKSHNGTKTVRILLDTLRNNPAEGAKETETTREIRGAISALQKLISKNSDQGYPAVSYALLADGLFAVSKKTSSVRTFVLVLQLINALFDDGEDNIHRLIVDEDWSVILDAASECAKKVTQLEQDPDRVRAPKEAFESVNRELVSLTKRLDALMNQKTSDFVPRQTVVRFLTGVHTLLPDATVSTVLDYFQQFRCCSPSDLSWENNLALVLKGFFGNRNRSSHIRLRSLETIMDAYEIVDLVGDDPEQSFIPHLAKSVLQNVGEETDVLVLEAIMSLMISVVASCEMGLFDYIIDALRCIVLADHLKSPIPASPSTNLFTPSSSDDPTPPPEQSPSNVVAKGYVKMFVQTMESHSSAKSIRLFNALVNIAKSNHCEVDARLTAMKLLCRLRGDWANRIFITKVLETNFVAATICRTEESLARRQAEEAAQALRSSRSEHGGSSRSSRGISLGQGQAAERGLPIRSGSVAGIRTIPSRHQQLWRIPDPDALPEGVTGAVSPVLVSHISEEKDLKNGETDDADQTDADESEERPNEGTNTAGPVVLNISIWLEAVLSLLHGCDWEVYCFVLVHLPSQLSNHALFRNSIPQIQELRRLICEHIRTNSFQEPPNASGLRRADVAICLFHSLTMILSYHVYFQKGEEDEIVKAFVHGITTWERSAKVCIHALSICCHELPLSTSKSLVQLLTKMSTIITQPHVAVHILEFLATLSRQHNIYVNFREEEYRIVFGICIRYIESVRDKKKRETSRFSTISEPSTPAGPGPTGDLPTPTISDDLPQYVNALAYHVILFWFLALKLPDRANLVGWLIRNLAGDNDDQADTERAITTVDFMQRATYANVDESSEDPLFTADRFGEIVTKRWLVGHSIVTVMQSINTGWAQVIKRQPSGTSVYMIRESINPPPAHQTKNYGEITREGQTSPYTVLPSYLLVQLLSPFPQGTDIARPVPLPDEEAVNMDIRVFDRSSTVDGHKVGIIYIGEGQTDEVEILANVSGSSDYVEFLNNIGTLTKLKGATFNTHGLDREFDSDGQYTFCWRDRVTEMVFHVTTQMPTNLDHDPRCTLKKRHIGNDFVNIVFNDSGLPFKFDTFPGDFNFVYIVITPASRASFIATRDSPLGSGQPFYRVQVLSKPGFPEISPASETKMVSLKALPSLIRLISLNASVFSHVWSNREGGEHVSSWRGRLRVIKRMREKYSPKPGNVTPSASQGSSMGGVAHQLQLEAMSRPNSTVRDSFPSLRRSSVATFFTSTSEQTSHRSSVTSTSTSDTEVGTVPSTESMVDTLDFSKWA
ncbi:hypothetical protein BGZ63DRAFT_356528 [Mariannaea sp. PMI_226]|nr:hypothetical protein BGZ63DRAFT_356528 [Mariannaea sp. PMI_226]